MKALIFGSIGVLADTSAKQLDAINRAFIVHELDWKWSEQEYRSMLTQAGGQNRIRWYAESVARIALDDSTIKSIHETKTRLFNDALELHGIELRPGIVRLLDDASSAGLPTAWVTSTNRSNLQAIANGSGEPALLDKFAYITHRGNVSEEKPHPSPYLETLQKLNLEPSEVIVIEDTQVCLASSLEAGLTTIATPTEFTKNQDFSGAVSVVSHLGDPNEPATVISGSNVLNQGMVSIAQLKQLNAEVV